MFRKVHSTTPGKVSSTMFGLTKDDNIVRISLFDKKTWEIGAIKLNNRRQIDSRQTSEQQCSTNKDPQSEMYEHTDREALDGTPETNDLGGTPS